MNGGRLVFPGDSSVSLIFDDAQGSVLDQMTNARCVAIAATLEGTPLRGILDVVPTFNAVTVYYDLTQISRGDVAAALGGCAQADVERSPEPLAPIEIPTVYGGEWGPDLEAIAEFAGCSPEDVVRMHAGRVYHVYMLGFLPGFAYMGSVDDRIAMPRPDVPRARVVAGSVGIAGAQTGVYPVDSPGGWRILGRTTTKVFDPSTSNPFLLKAGDQVQFVAA